MKPDPTEPFQKAVAWEATTVIDRAEQCRIYLRVRRLLGDAENEKIKARMQKWHREAMKP